jgi:hypothetical protein
LCELWCFYLTVSSEISQQVQSIILKTMGIPALQRCVCVDLYHVSALALGTNVHAFKWESGKLDCNMSNPGGCYGRLLAGKPHCQTTFTVTGDLHVLPDQRVGLTVDGNGTSRVLYKSMKVMKRSTLLYATLFGVCPTRWMTNVIKQPLLPGETAVVSIQAGSPPAFVVHHHNGAYYYAAFTEGGLLQLPRFLCTV